MDIKNPLLSAKKIVGKRNRNFIVIRTDAFTSDALHLLSLAKEKSIDEMLEALLTDTLLPEDASAKNICIGLITSRFNNYVALSKMFSLYAAGLNFQARFHNGLELVEYLHCSLEFIHYPTDKDSEGERNYFCQNFKKLVEIISTKKEQDPLFQERIKSTKALLEEAQTCPKEFIPINFTQFVKDNWDVLGNNTYTYRALAALCRLIIYQKLDSAEERIELIKLISLLSREWE